MGAKPSSPAAQPGPSNQVPMGQPVGVVPMGQPVLTEEDRKIESMKWKSKLLNIIACMAVATVSVPTVYYGSETEGCSGYLIRTIFAWAAMLGLLLIAAELEMGCVTTHLHILTYRSGRALVLVFLGSIALAATPAEIPIAAAVPGMVGPMGRARVLIAINWKL